ncbi:MAG: ATP-dependent protease subunit HslV [bacterium]
MRRPLHPRIRSTTVVGVRRGGKVVIAGDGQVSIGDTIVKGTARKVRPLSDGKILAGFAGSAADGIALFEKLDTKLQEYNQNLTRAAVELAKDWRMDKVMRRLEALLLVADREHLYLISGTGDVLEPDGDVVAIGSGGSYATAAARALLRHTDMDAKTIAEEALLIAASICIYTNDSITVMEIDHVE